MNPQTPITQVTLWYGDGGTEQVVGRIVGIAATGVAVQDPQDAAHHATVFAARRGRTVGALLVPADLGGGVTINGTPAGIGLHVLRHGDRIDMGGHPTWVSADTEPVETTYDPAQHGDDQRCLRTRTRLAAGEPIVVCPGTPTTPCAGMFKRTAWRPTLRCHQCGFDPRARRWRPPARRGGPRLAELLAMAKEGRDAR